MRKINATLVAVGNDLHGFGPGNLPTEKNVHHLMVIQKESVKFWKEQGYSVFGTANVEYQIEDDVEKLVAEKVDSLKAEAKKIRAEAQVRVNAIEEKVKQLLAISYDTGRPD